MIWLFLFFAPSSVNCACDEIVTKHQRARSNKIWLNATSIFFMCGKCVIKRDWLLLELRAVGGVNVLWVWTRESCTKRRRIHIFGDSNVFLFSLHFPLASQNRTQSLNDCLWGFEALHENLKKSLSHTPRAAKNSYDIDRTVPLNIVEYHCIKKCRRFHVFDRIFHSVDSALLWRQKVEN